MNKKIMILVMSLYSGNSVVAMHGKVLSAAQIITGGALIGGGIVISLFGEQERSKPIDDTMVKIPPRSDKFVRSVLHECHYSDADTIPLFIDPDASWTAYSNNSIGVSPVELFELEIALNKRERKILAEKAMIVKHEAGTSY